MVFFLVSSKVIDYVLPSMYKLFWNLLFVLWNQPSILQTNKLSKHFQNVTYTAVDRQVHNTFWTSL